MSLQDDMIASLSETRRQLAQSPISQARSRGATYAIVHWASDTGGTEGLLCGSTGTPLSPSQLVWIDETSAPDAIVFGGAYYMVEPTTAFNNGRRVFRILGYAGGGNPNPLAPGVLVTSVISSTSYGTVQDGGASLTYSFNGSSVTDTVCISTAEAYTAGSNGFAYPLARPFHSIPRGGLKAFVANGGTAAFSAAGSGAFGTSLTTVNYLYAGMNATINIGSGYSATSGAFVAPYPGTYYFSAFASYNGAGTAAIQMQLKDESLSTLISTYSPFANFTCATLAYMRTMNTGQSVTYLAGSYSGTISIQFLFCGYRIA